MFTKFVENFLMEDECDNIIKLGESIGLEKMLSTKIVDGKIIAQGIEYSENKRMGGYFIGETLENDILKKLTNKVVGISNAIKPFNSIEYTNVPKYSFNRYSDGDFLDWHEDRHEVLLGATITFIIQLNSNYKEGYVRYIIDGIEYKVPKIKGSAFIFDSNILHSVDKIASGNRYSLNVWPNSKKKISLI